MPYANEIRIMGHACKDSEVRATKNGAEFASFSIAVSRGKPKDGYDEKTDFFNVKRWKGKSDWLPECKKGDLVEVQGRIEIDRSGVGSDAKTFVNVIASRVVNYDEWRRRKNAKSSNGNYVEQSDAAEPEEIPFDLGDGGGDEAPF